MDTAGFRKVEHLRNGTRVTIRAIRADDKPRVVSAFQALEPDSVYTRFFSPKKELSAEDLKRLTEVDQMRDVALVATIGTEETFIGGGRYVSSGSAAEIAFTVEEDYQGQGIASRLLRHLVHIARANGIARFEAHVLAGNEPMLGVFRRSGLRTTQRRADGEWLVTLEL
jgi:RimJ/RimL family protein N-acetyltransferase